MDHTKFKCAIGFALVLVMGWLVYRPGLSGTFLFDDFANLPALGQTGPVDDAATFWRFVTSGYADPTGRPVALLSFLLDARDWPAPALPFKRTNLFLHLLNGLLLFLLLRRLGSEGGPFMPDRARRVDAAAGLGAAFWLLHPLFVSTTLYVVQREAMLPTLFTLAGLLGWLRGRKRLQRGALVPGVLWLVWGLGFCTLLATLSKANGALLPALALTIEYSFLRPWTFQSPSAERTNPLYGRLMFVLAAIPSAAIAAYLLYVGWRGIAHGISAARPWLLTQRLLTEPRVLLDYLDLLWLPRPFTPGLFNDQIHASTGWWSPISTLPALLAITGLVVAAVALRRRLPALALAILFFFVAQSIESSTVALELFFEHRNYLPAIVMFWPLALWLCDANQTPGGSARRSDDLEQPARGRFKAALTLVLIAGLASMTYARAALWGNTHDQALLWARLNPSSPRAQAYAAQAEMAAGRPERATARLRDALAQAPDEIQLSLNLLAAECQSGHISDSSMEAAARSLRTSRNTGTLLEHWFERALEQTSRPPCPELNLSNLATLQAAASANETIMALPSHAQELKHLQGRIDLMRGYPDKALSDFNGALDRQVRIEAALQQAALLGASGYPELGLAHLAHYEASADGPNAYRPPLGMARVHAWVLRRQGYWDREMDRLHATLREDAAEKQRSGGTGALYPPDTGVAGTGFASGVPASQAQPNPTASPIPSGGEEMRPGSAWTTRTANPADPLQAAPRFDGGHR
ncbi:tetratricopeptide repeat protein [Frateuria sp. GZRe12]|uniref:tetratricopeptide repeat protein n=1 Tax=Frateuria sp. GZRe12 TaxID=3351533 RepID=UPI003EDC57F9